MQYAASDLVGIALERGNEEECYTSYVSGEDRDSYESQARVVNLTFSAIRKKHARFLNTILTDPRIKDHGPIKAQDIDEMIDDEQCLSMSPLQYAAEIDSTACAQVRC